MSLPFFVSEIFVNSDAICWWCPHFLGLGSNLHMKSGQTSFTKYIKLSWHNFMCSIHFFSTANRSCSFVSNSFCIGSPFNITHNKNIVTTSIDQSLKASSSDTSSGCAWRQYLVLKFGFGTRFGTSIGRWCVWKGVNR